MKNFLQHTVAPIVAAFIWGTAFSMQSVAGQYVPSFAVNAFRGLVTFAVLAAVCLLFRIRTERKKDAILGSLVVGTALFLASNLQQFGIVETSAGKSGFITALYIVLVPIASLLLFKRKSTPLIWLAVLIAVAGLYFLSITESFTIGIGDISLILCAVLFTVQILSIDHYSLKVHSLVLSAGMFLVSGTLSLICSLLFETAGFSGIRYCFWEMMYIAVFSSCIAYTLQIVAQKGGNPTVVSLLMSLESVFAALGGMVILNERLSGRELFGCCLMAVAIVIAQLPAPPPKKNI